MWVVLLHAADLNVPVVYGFVLRMFVSESIMIYDSFAEFSGVLHIATSFGRSCWKLSKTVKTFQDASEIVDFIGRAPTPDSV